MQSERSTVVPASGSPTSVGGGSTADVTYKETAGGLAAASLAGSFRLHFVVDLDDLCVSSGNPVQVDARFVIGGFDDNGFQYAPTTTLREA